MIYEYPSPGSRHKRKASPVVEPRTVLESGHVA
jgi:hypothetical protein